MLELILTLLVIFAAPLPFWLSFLHIFPKKIISYFSISVMWLICGYLAFTNNIFAEKIITGPLWIVPGLVILLMAIFIDWNVMRTLGLKRIACVSEINNEKSGLVTVGIYKYARHPRYVEYPLLSLGLGLVYGYVFLLWFALYLFIGFWIASYFEEAELVKRFGKEYKLYQKNVPRYFVKLF